MKQPTHPPKWADKFLGWFCAEDLLEEIQGDLHEAWYLRKERLGTSQANRLFIADVFTFFKPYAFEKYSRAKQFLPMMNNYFKIALRNIWHRKGFTAINLIGLTLGISAVVLIALYLKNELTYDQNIPQAESIYRLQNNYREQIYTNMSFPNYNNSSAKIQRTLVNHLEEYDEVATACQFVPTQSDIGGRSKLLVKFGSREFVADNALYSNTGEHFQAIFPQEFLLGTPENAFSDFQKMVLTEKLAKQWFGENWRLQNLIGQSVEVQDTLYQLAGIIANPPSNQHFGFDLILHQQEIPSWGAYTYLKLTENANIASVTEKLNSNVETVFPRYNKDGLAKGISAIALPDIHFSQGNLYEIKPTANKTYLYTFGIVGFMILLIIWTNYTNLSVAMYADRQKELGMRKVLGARSQDIGFQLLTEAVLLTLLCFPFCLLLLQHAIPKFSELMDIETSSLFFNSFTFSLLLSLLILTGILSGIYPAIAYGNKSMLRLFGKKMNAFSGSRFFNFRNGLLTFQFVMMVALLSITWIIFQQMQYIQQRDLGFEKEGVIYFNVDDVEKFQQLKTALTAIPEVKSVGANGIPGSEMFNQFTYKMDKTDVVLSDGTMNYLSLGSVKTLGIDCPSCNKLSEGKKRLFLINQTAAEKLAKIKGITPEALVGETVITEPEYENEEYGFGIPYVVDGIVPDFNFFSLKYEMQPLFLNVYQEMPFVYEMLVKAETDNWNGTLAKIETVYKQIENVQPFDVAFLEDRLDKLYTEDRRSGILIGILSLLALILALMGLAGVVSYIAYSRQKEIGIRKVLGASVSDILLNFNKEFMMLMGVSIIISLPISLYFSSKWLDSFAFRIEPQFWMVLLAGLVAMLLVAIVVTWRANRAAGEHPIEVLRND